MAIIYVKKDAYNELWNSYKNSIQEFVFDYPIPKPIMEDLTSDYLKDTTDIRIGLTQHSREGQLVKLYHLFVNMKF